MKIMAWRHEKSKVIIGENENESENGNEKKKNESVKIVK